MVYKSILEESSDRIDTAKDEATTHIDNLSFDPLQKGLPLGIASQCLKCTRVLVGQVEKEGERLVLKKTCPEHGPIKEYLNDTLFIEYRSNFPDSPTKTYCGSKIRPIVRKTPKTVESLCPVCKRNILGRIFEWEGKIYMEKTCPEHGYVKDLINSNARLYDKCNNYTFEDAQGLLNPKVTDGKHCPTDCGLCNQHLSSTVLSNIDLTNRCNLTCPICFANANVQGYVYEPEFDEVAKMLQAIRDERPIPGVVVQFSGGEPTLHPQFPEIIRKARELGFTQIQMATNGIKMSDFEYAKTIAEAGMHTLYLQFDGIGDEPYRKTRGRPLWDIKLKCIENCRKLGLKICLVPTIVKGINDSEVPNILRFACDNADVISGIAYQPVSFTGRISKSEREARRFTLGDLTQRLSETGWMDPVEDFYPIGFISPISKLLSALTGDPKIILTCHSDCGLATYAVVDKTGKAIPMSRLFRVEKLLSEMNEIAKKSLKKKSSKLNKFFTKIKTVLLFAKHMRKRDLPEGLSLWEFLKSLRGLVDKKHGRGEKNQKNWRTIMVGGMHFQDLYNYNIERSKRCVIHYSTPQGLYSFCTYNGGPTFRPEIEKKYSISWDEWQKRNPGRARND